MGQLHYPPNQIPANVDPPGLRCIQITIPDDDEWEQLLYSVIYRQLAMVWTNWQRTGDRTGADLNIRWRQALRTWKHCDNGPVPLGTLVEFNAMDNLIQVICDDSGKCILQYRCDVCSPWQTAANITDLQTNPSGGGNQPAPGGGSSTDCVTIYCNQEYTIPIPVTTGDKIEITSATGKWSDQFARWLCIDGNLFFIDCTGVGGASGASGDPLPSANHLSAIVRFSTGYYALYPGASLIVPSGVSNEQPTILANKPTVNSGSGWIDICWKVTNNAIKTWCHNLDFTLAPYGFVSDPREGYTAAWTPGIGWLNTSGSGHKTEVKFTSGTAFTITKIEWVCSDTNASPADASAGWYFPVPTQFPGAQIDPTMTGPNSGSGSGHVTNTLMAYAQQSDNGGTIVLVSARISGVGFDPFAAYPTC